MSLPPGNLAVLGAGPAFATPLHVGRPSVIDRRAFLDRVGAILDRSWFTNHGPEVAELEARLAQRLDVPHCVVVDNGTSALRLLVRACGLRGQVILPSFTFIATAHALAWEGLEPVFCDIDPVTWNLDADACEAALTPETQAILGVHVFGRPCDTERLQALADRRSIPLLFDAAHAFGCSHRGRPVGGFGHAEVLSFHATKAFHTFEGGAVTTRDDALAERLRLFRNFGFRGYDDVASLGINAKMPEVCAAMGLVNLERFDETRAHNRRVVDTYERGLTGIVGLTLRTSVRDDGQNWHYVPVAIDAASLGLTRDELHQALAAENVLARRYFYPGCHASEPYVSAGPGVAERLPNTVAATAAVLVLPAGGSVAEEEASQVCSLVRAIVARAPEVRRRLSAFRPRAAVTA